MKRRQEYAVIVVLALIGSAVFGVFLFSSPTASIDVTTSQSDAGTTAASFLEEQGYDIDAYQTSTVFTARDRSATFIQRRLSGQQERSELTENNIYFWETRFYQSLEQETFRVAIDAGTGSVVGFTHELPDEASGGNLSADLAQDRAETFLSNQGHDLDQYELISSSSTDRPNRVDHEFTWKHTSREIAGAPFYLEVTIQGDRIGGYNPHINVPDQFTHQYQITQNRGQLLAFTALGLTILIALLGIGFGLRYYKAETFDWRLALTIGAVVFVLTVLSAVNSIPSLLHSLPTTMSPMQFLLISVGGAAIGGLIIGGLTTVMVGAGKQLSRSVLGYEPISRLRPLWTDGESRTELQRELLLGVLFAGIILGVYAVFYLIGTRFFGFWLPSQPPQIGAVSMYVPAIMALVVGGTAALWEEATYRLFAIPLTKRYLKYTALAILIPAFVWGLGHSGYAVLPYWARAVEVTLIGIVLGVAYLRYGIITTVSAHFTLNAFVTALPMALAGTSWLMLNGVIGLLIAALPLLAAGGLALIDRS